MWMGLSTLIATTTTTTTTTTRTSKISQDCVGSCWDDLSRHSQQHVDAVQAATTLVEQREALSQQRAWQAKAAWQISQKSCIHTVVFAVWQARIQREQLRI